MNDADNLVEAWIRLHHIPKESRQSTQYDELFWSWEKLTEMCDSAPETAWDAIQEIIGRDHSDQILASIGAGPFEDLMGSHGAQFIDRVEKCARTHPAFRRMLGIVWNNSISDDVWIRIQAIALPSW
jgi:Family of unknown function (DUF6869)